MTEKDLFDLVDPKQPAPPFEAFYGKVLALSGSARQSLLRIFEIGVPNTNHYFCTHLLLRRLADIYTTNFDLMFEQAMLGTEYQRVCTEPDMQDYLRRARPVLSLRTALR